MLKAHTWALYEPEWQSTFLNPAVVHPQELHLVQSSTKQDEMEELYTHTEQS